MNKYMGLFKSEATFDVPTYLIPSIVSNVCDDLTKEQYEVKSEILVSGGAYISITKGNVFKAVIGLKTALKINITPQGNNAFLVEASVGIFGQQAIPTAISMLIAWPILIPQIWGLIQQSKLDDHVIELIRENVNKHQSTATEEAGLYCSHCGHKLSMGDQFCGGCGGKL